MSQTPLARIAGPLAILAGTLVIGTRLVTMLTTPSELGDGLKALALSPIFAVNSVLSIIAFAFLALALVAVYEREGHAAGWFGVIGVGAALIGTMFMTGDWWYEAFAVPWMADVAPAVFETGAGGRLLVGGLASFALFAIGWALFGAASLRARVFPRSISWGIVIGGVLAGIPIAGAYLYGSLLFGLAITALGVWLVRTAVGNEPAAPPSPTQTPDRSQYAGVVAFFGLSLALPVIALAAGTPPSLLPFILAVGPLGIALLLSWREGHGAVRRLMHSLTIRPTRRIWYLVLAIPVAWSLLTVGVAVALGEPTGGLFDAVFPAVLIIPIVVLLPAITEELAWRGYALPRLLTWMSPLTASLVLAVPWILIHVALFMPGQWYGDLAIWPLFVSIASYSILLTWVYIGTGGSVLMTALFHAGLNGMAPVMGGLDGDSSWAIRNVLAAVIALAVVALGGLRRPSPSDEGRPANLLIAADPIHP